MSREVKRIENLAIGFFLCYMFSMLPFIVAIIIILLCVAVAIIVIYSGAYLLGLIKPRYIEYLEIYILSQENLEEVVCDKTMADREGE